MKCKARMLAALRGQSVDRLPVAPIYLHLFLAQEVRCQALRSYEALLGERMEVRLTPDAEITIQALAIQTAWRTLGTTPDWIWANLLPPAAWLADCTLRREGDQLWRVHQPSGEREELSQLAPPNDSTADLWQVPPPASRTEVDELLPQRSTQEMLEDGSLGLLRHMVKTMGHETFVYGKMGTPFWRSYSILGFMGLMTLPLERPQLFHYLLERQTQAALALVRAYAAAGAHGVFIEECLTSAGLLSPRLYDEFVFPYDQVLMDELRALDLPAVLYVCGDVNPRLPRLVELAPAALAVEESKKGFRLDLAEVAAAVGGRMAILGNLDATCVKDWDRDELRRQLRAQAKAARPARGFIVSIGSPFPLDTPCEKVADFVAAAQSDELAAIWKCPAAQQARPGG